MKLEKSELILKWNKFIVENVSDAKKFKIANMFERVAETLNVNGYSVAVCCQLMDFFKDHWRLFVGYNTITMDKLTFYVQSGPLSEFLNNYGAPTNNLEMVGNHVMLFLINNEYYLIG